jgi:integrase
MHPQQVKFSTLGQQRNKSRYPAPDFVVSRDIDGRALSHYGDLSWDWTPYEANGASRKLHFCFWENDHPTSETSAILDEQKWLMYLVIWKNLGPPPSAQTVYHYHKLLRTLAKFCYKKSTKISDVLSSSSKIKEMVFMLRRQYYTRCLRGLLSLLGELGESEVGFSVPGQRLAEELKLIASKFGPALEQCSPLPTRIYSHVISNLASEVAAFEAIEQRFFDAILSVLADPACGRGKSRQYVVAQAMGVRRDPDATTYKDLIKNFEIESYLQARGGHKSIKGLTHTLLGIQVALRLSVQLYSGMRAEEATALKVGCLREEKRWGQIHFLVSGSTTKLNNGKARPATWVTSREGARAIRLAERIARFIAEVAPTQNMRTSTIPLFISVRYLPFIPQQGILQSPMLIAPKLDLGNVAWLRKRIQPEIGEEDIRELEMIDPHRAWRADVKYRVGAHWTLTSHQLRRSLALYAQRSGLVSLPSLRRQLQHITEEMSRYYARGSIFAKQFIGDIKDHFGNEWQATHSESSALSYLLNVIYSDETLFGGHAHWVNHRARTDDGKFLVDRKTTMQQFKRGELSYRESPLGGCTKIGECEQTALKWLNTDCLSGCKNLVGHLSKLERAIQAQQKLLTELDSTSIQFRMENFDLDVMISARDRVVNEQKDL